MMKAHNIAPNAASVRASPAARTFKIERRNSSSVAKKRKVDDFANDHGGAEDDQEHFDNVKPEPGNATEELRVKEEPGQMHSGASEDVMHYYSPMSTGSQSYLSVSNPYSDGDGFNTNANHGNIYGLPHRPGFMDYNGYEQSDTGGVETTAGQVGDPQLGDSQQSVIMIGD
jgi:hypothetical protein